MRNNENAKTIHQLQFNVAQLLKEATGATRIFNINTAVIVQVDAGMSLAAPLTGTVSLLRTGQDILVSGRLQTAIQKKCGRCLTDFSAPVEFELEEIFYPTLDLVTGNPLPPPPDADEANRISLLHTLDLNEVVRQALLLENEGVRYCKPDCRGLCPHCGQDQNTGSCSCQDETIDHRWAGLLEIQIEE